jgi:hypothetical protein
MSSRKARRKARRQQRQSEFQTLKAAQDRNGTVWLCDEDAFVDLSAKDADGPPKFVMNPLYSGGLMRPAGVPIPAVLDLATLQAADDTYPALLDHKDTQRVGHFQLKNDGKQLRSEGVVSAKTDAATEVLGSHKDGFRWRPSVRTRFSLSNVRIIEPGQELRANGRTMKFPHRVAFIRNAVMQEGSFVSVPGDESSEVTILAAAAAAPQESEMKKELREFILAAGVADPDSLDKEQVSLWGSRREFIMKAGIDKPEALTKEQIDLWKDQYELKLKASAGNGGDGKKKPAEGEDTLAAGAGGDGAAALDDLLNRGDQRMAAELDRRDNIRELCASFDNPTIERGGEQVLLASYAIQNKWSVEKAELELRRQDRNQHVGTAIHSRSHSDDCNLAAMQGAAMLTHGIDIESELYAQGGVVRDFDLPRWLRQSNNSDDKQQILEASYRYRGMSAIDVCREAIRLDGGNLFDLGNNYEGIVQAAFSGANLQHIWTTSVLARLVQKYTEAEDNTVGWTLENTSIPNFKEQERIRLKKGGTALTKHGRGGEAEHVGRDDTKEGYRIARYSNQFTVDEMDVIDDDLSAISDMPDEMGLAAARLRPDLVFALLLSNPNLKDGNPIFSGASLRPGKALTAENLAAAITALAVIQEGNVNLSVRASHLILPEALSFLADQILNSVERRETGTENGTKNTLRGKIRHVVSDPRLDNGVYDPNNEISVAGTTDDWFLASDARPSIEVGYLRSSGRAPQVKRFSSNGEHGKWFVGWSTKLDVGAGALNREYIQKNEAP